MLPKIGVVLFLFSVVWCGTSLLLPQLFAPLGQSFCQAGETYQSQVVTSSSLTRSTIGTVYVCVDAAGNQRNIRGEMTQITMIVFLGALFGSFGLIGFGVKDLAKNMPPKPRPNDTSTRKMRPDSDGDTLSVKLAQLEEARIKELISEDEYRRLRQEALDEHI